MGVTLEVTLEVILEVVFHQEPNVGSNLELGADLLNLRKIIVEDFNS